ncbi:DUF4270 domain-containing protein [Aquimarina aquimarini]|uniref:DUF4270 domain-containing protein n=1 Tax=Aquimarina aquimarini TaxID=1191734 RepID=UPI000D552FE6|nr:DUF4270 domain-containing protein [Aquimarina aquimarini]
MKLKNTFFKITTIVVVVSAFFSCNDDFNTVGSEVIGDINFKDDQYAAIPKAYSKRFERVRSNNLVKQVSGNQVSYHANMLGVYDDPVYGQSTYSVLSQVQLQQLNPNFGTNAVLDSVVFSMPYLSRATGTTQVQIDANTTETATTYSLDSVYGNQPIKLSLYKSNYFLRDFDPATDERQVYFSDDINTNFAAEVEKTLLYTNDSFVPSAKEVVLRVETASGDNTTTTRSRLTPRLRFKFSEEIKTLFKTLFLDKQGSSELSNANNFRNYFRGIYVKAEPEIGGGGNLVYLNMRDAQITLHYSFDVTNTSNSTTTRDQGELVLGFSNTVINSIESNLNTVITDELKEENQDAVNGEESLYLKGGDGAYAIVDLFGGNITNEKGEEENELDFLKRQDWLVNEASLTFYIDKNKVTTGGDTEPERIYIFNAETGEPLIDYVIDGSDSSEQPLLSRVNHLGPISRDSDKNGEFYKIQVTQHVINVLNGDTENVKLGVSVSQNINYITVVDNTPTIKTDNEIIPTSSIVSHEGTILYGNGAGVPESKRLKLDIFYTAAK